MLGAGIRTNNLAVCQEYKFWQDKPCFPEDEIRCKAGVSGQCVDKEHWGADRKKFSDGSKGDMGETYAGCKDGSDLYRPIVKREELGCQPSQRQVWKTRPKSEETYKKDYMRKEEGTKYTIPESDPFCL